MMLPEAGESPLDFRLRVTEPVTQGGFQQPQVADLLLHGGGNVDFPVIFTVDRYLERGTRRGLVPAVPGKLRVVLEIRAPVDDAPGKIPHSDARAERQALFYQGQVMEKPETVFFCLVQLRVPGPYEHRVRDIERAGKKVDIRELLQDLEVRAETLPLYPDGGGPPVEGLVDNIPAGKPLVPFQACEVEIQPARDRHPGTGPVQEPRAGGTGPHLDPVIARARLVHQARGILHDHVIVP